MFTLIVSTIIATGLSAGTATVRINHQVMGTDWASKEVCEEAARVISASHSEAFVAIKQMQSHPRHGGPFIQTKCIVNSEVKRK